MEQLQPARVGEVGRVGVHGECEGRVRGVGRVGLGGEVPEAAVVRGTDEGNAVDEGFGGVWGGRGIGDKAEAVSML